MSTVEIYNKSSEALDTLSNVWQTMICIIQSVSAASAASLTVEPDLVKLQKIRKEYEQLMASLKAAAAWLQTNTLKDEDLELETEEYKKSLTQQSELEQESIRVNDQLKRLLNQSYALQFQIEMLFNSSQDVKLN